MDDKTRHRFNTIINIMYAALIVTILYLSFKYVLGWILPFIIAFAIVTIMNPIIKLLKKIMRTQKEIVSFFVMFLLFAGVGTGLFFLIMNLVFLVRDMLEMMSGYLDSSSTTSIALVGDKFDLFLRNLPEDWYNIYTTIKSSIADGISSSLKSFVSVGVSVIAGFTSAIPGFLIAFIFTIMLSFFISMKYDSVLVFIKKQMPKKIQNISSELKGILKDTILKYISAYIKLMIITAVEMSIGLLVLRTPNAIFIGIGIAIFDALPVFGTGAIVIPWIIVEFIKGNFTFAIGLAILYAIITVIRNIIEPKIIGDKLGLNPIVSLISIYLGFKLMGVLGMIIMPIVTQIILELNNRGIIHLFATGNNNPEPETEEEMLPKIPENSYKH